MPMTSPRDPLPTILSGPEIRRRDALKLIGVGLALAKTGCMDAPGDPILPYVHRPPELHPGGAVYYATAIVEDGYATGLVVETHQGRPTKIEGNPAHPASLGATTAPQQAS